MTTKKRYFDKSFHWKFFVKVPFLFGQNQSESSTELITNYIQKIAQNCEIQR